MKRRTICVAGIVVLGAALPAQNPQTPQIVAPMAADATPKFEVVTVKPSDPERQGKMITTQGRHVITANTTLVDLIAFAYGLHAKQIADGPAWLASDRFDIDGVPDVEGEPNLQQIKMLLQQVLANRFQFRFHPGQKKLSVYVLTVAKNGPRMAKSELGPGPHKFGIRKPGALIASNSTMQDFCGGMQSLVMDKPVVDHTGLTERYDFELKWTPDQSQFGGTGARLASADDADVPPTLYTAIQEQLGLKLEAAQAQVDVIVIDKVEKPTEN